MSDSKPKNDADCGKGMILRKGYKRSSYYRSSYTRADGTHVPETFVEESYVEPTCIIDRGKPGRGKNILPQPDGKIHLSNYGYRTYNSKQIREKALRDASNEFGALPVLRHLNLLRNFQSTKHAKDIMNSDVEYMKSYYKRVKQKGGNNEEPIIKKTINVREEHVTDNLHVIFSTLDEKDIDDMCNVNDDLNDKCKESIKKLIEQDNVNLVGLTVNDKLEGWAAVIDKEPMSIIAFHVKKGYNQVLFKFIEKYAIMNNYQTINVLIDISKSDDSVSKLNFWHRVGFMADKLIDNKNTILMFKDV